jgi:hypothetical protein
MSYEICSHCNAIHQWTWEEAFSKSGFNDGDGIVMTDTVVDALAEAGYDVIFNHPLFHNEVIFSIKRDGNELIPTTATVGCDDPREYLPQAVIKLLDATFPNDSEEVAPWL